MANFERDFIKSTRKRAFIIGLIIGFILMPIWAALITITPAGWLMALLNIGLFVITLIVVGSPLVQFLRLYMPWPVTIIPGGFILFLYIVLFRSIFLNLFGII